MSSLPKHTILWKWIAVLATALTLIVVFSCNTPFIPIPPPNPTFDKDPSGEWSVSTPADSKAIGAKFYIYNSDLGSGLIQKSAADGSMYARPLQGKEGDSIYIHWERSGSDTSSTICRPLGQGLVQGTCQ
jgi:hypothetical protein